MIDWRGQAVSAQRQTALLHGVPVLVAWGADDTTIPRTTTGRSQNESPQP